MDWYLIAWFMVFFSFTVITRTTQAGRLLNSIHPPPSRSFSNQQPQLTFFMQDVLVNNKPPPTQANVAGGSGFPFPKPGNLFPPKDGIPLTTPISRSPIHGGLAYLTNLKSLEVGMVTAIDEVLTDGYMTGSPLVGRVRGIAVTSSEESEGQMIAMTATFDENGEDGDSLKFFGLHHAGASESHIAVIGGTGKYHEANGFATVGNASNREIVGSSSRSLSITVHLR